MPKLKIPVPPRGTGRNGGKLWRDVLGRYELEQHEMALLREIRQSCGHEPAPRGAGTCMQHVRRVSALENPTNAARRPSIISAVSRTKSGDLLWDPQAGGELWLAGQEVVVG